MTSVGHCTQRKPGVCGNPRLVVPFVPKLLAHQIFLFFKMVEITQKPHDAMVPKRRVIVKKNHGMRLPFLPPWPSARRPGRRFLQQSRFPPISLATETGASRGRLLVHCGISPALWLPGLGYWFYTRSQFLKLTDLKIYLAASYPQDHWQSNL